MLLIFDLKKKFNDSAVLSTWEQIPIFTGKVVKGMWIIFGRLNSGNTMRVYTTQIVRNCVRREQFFLVRLLTIITQIQCLTLVWIPTYRKKKKKGNEKKRKEKKRQEKEILYIRTAWCQKSVYLNINDSGYPNTQWLNLSVKDKCIEVSSCQDTLISP